MEQENNNAIEGFPRDIEKPEPPRKWHPQQEKVLKSGVKPPRAIDT